MDNELMLDVGQANELKLAFRRAGFTNNDIKRLCEGNTLKDVLGLIRGTAQIKPADPPELKVFKTIRLGTGLKTVDEFCEALEASGCDVSDWARDIMSQPGFRAASEESAVDLVALTVGELGFSEGAAYRKICERARELGLKLCPAEAGPQLRLRYTDQPHGEWLIIAMEPIAVSGGYLGVLYVKHDGLGRRLSAHCGASGYRWDADRRFVFLSSKQLPAL